MVSQFVRCGKPGCRCNYGEGHGPYFYRVWREGERVRKVYVKRSEVEAVRRQTRRYEELGGELRRLRAQRLSVLAERRERQKIRRALLADWPKG